MKYIENFRCTDFNKRFFADVDKAAIADGSFGYTATFIESRKYNYYVTLYDIDTDNNIAKELIKDVRVEGEGNNVNIFYEDNVEYKVYLLNEKAEEVEKNLKNKLNIK